MAAAVDPDETGAASVVTWRGDGGPGARRPGCPPIPGSMANAIRSHPKHR